MSKKKSVQAESVVSEKPLLCTVENWWPVSMGDVYIIQGYGFKHPKFGWCDWFHTSVVLTPKKQLKEGAIIETLNSRYKLGKKAPQ